MKLRLDRETMTAVIPPFDILVNVRYNVNVTLTN